MIKVYAGIRLGHGKATQGRVCDDRILLGHRIGDMGYYEYDTEGDSTIVAVSDGVGGCNSGWKAAEVALNEVANWPETLVKDEDALKNAFLQVNQKVVTESFSLPEYEGMAATLSVLLISDTHTRVLHVGDSRVYHIGNVQGCDFFGQVTEDQNCLQLWMKEKQYRSFSMNDLKKYDGWERIISYVGMPETDFVERMCMIDIVNSKGTYIVTSDGVHDFIEDELIQMVLKEEGNREDKLKKILDIAVENGSCDDQSIIVVEVK